MLFRSTREFCNRLLFNNHLLYLPLDWAHGQKRFLEMLKAVGEITILCYVMQQARRYFCPAAGAGSQAADWETHKEFAQLVLLMIERRKKEWEDEEEEDEE